MKIKIKIKMHGKKLSKLTHVMHGKKISTVRPWEYLHTLVFLFKN